MELGYSKSDEPLDVRWDDFRAFEAIAKLSSIKRAAAALGTTQSALSKRLSRLEHLLGVRLVDRGPTGARLTYQGERVYARVLAAQKELSRAAIEAHIAESRVEGDCSLLMGDGIANFWFAQFVQPFFERYPNIELKVVLDHDLGAARNQIFDIRLHYYEPIDPSQVMRPLATVHFMPFASKRYIETFGKPKAVAELVKHRFVDQAQHILAKGPWNSWSGEDMLKRTALFTNQSAFLARCVIEGVGIALMPTYMTLAYPELVPLDLDVALPAKLYASYHRERATTQAVKSMLNFLRGSVFSVKHMPWFDETLIFPQPDWAEKLVAFKRTLTEPEPGTLFSAAAS